MANQAEGWSAWHASYVTHATQSFIKRLKSENRPYLQKYLIPDTDENVSELLVCSRGMRCDWKLKKGGPIGGGVLQSVDGSRYFLIHSKKLYLPLPASLGPPSKVDRHSNPRGFKTRWGTTRLNDYQIQMPAGGYVYVRTWILEIDGLPTQRLRLWWSSILPCLGDLAGMLGLPTRLEITVESDEQPAVVMELIDLQEKNIDLQELQVPSNYRIVESKGTKVRHEGSGIRDKNKSPSEIWGALAKRTGARPPQPRFAATLRDDVRLLLSNPVIDHLVETFNRLWSYLDGLSGREFRFRWDWLDQIRANGRNPDRTLGRPTTHWFLPRIGLAMLNSRIQELRQVAIKSESPMGVTAGVNNPDVATSVRYAAGTLNVLDAGWMKLPVDRTPNQPLQYAEKSDGAHFQIFLPPGAMPISIQFLVADLGAATRQLPFEKQGEWGIFVHTLASSLLPTLQWMLGPQNSADAFVVGAFFDPATRQSTQDALFLELGAHWLRTHFQFFDWVAALQKSLPSPAQNDNWYFELPDSIKSDGLQKLINVELSDWEQEIQFGRQPLTTPFVFVDGSQFNIFANLFPNLVPRIFKFALTSFAKLKQLRLTCNVAVNPTVSAETVALGLFCPPCLLALILRGSASISVENLQTTVLISVSQDDLGFDPAKVELRLSDFTADVDVDAFLLGAFPEHDLVLSKILALITNVILSLFADVIRDAIKPIRLFKAPSGSVPTDNEVTWLEALVQNLVSVDFENLRRAAADAVRAAQDAVDHASSDTARQAATAALSRAKTGARNAQNHPVVGQTRYSADVVDDTHYHLAVSGRVAGRGPQGPLTLRPGEIPLDTELMLLFSFDYLAESVGELRAVGFSGVADTDWWQAPDQANIQPKPSNIQSGPPPVVLQPGQPIPDWWGLSSMMTTTFERFDLFTQHQPLIEQQPVPDQPLGQVVLNVAVEVTAAHYVPYSYDACKPIDRPPDRPGVPAGGPDVGPSIDPGPILAGFGFARSATVFVGRSFSHDGLEESVPGGFGPGGFPPDLGMPPPDDSGPPQTGGSGYICQTVTGWREDKEETWLRVQLQISIPLWMGILDVFNQGEPLVRVLPLLGYRTRPEQARVVNNSMTISTSGPLAGLDSAPNQAWLQGVLLDKIRQSFMRPRDAHLQQINDIHYDYGLSVPTTLEPEGFSPFVFVSLDTAASLARFGQPPQHIAFETFGPDISRRSLALGFRFFENILDRL